MTEQELQALRNLGNECEVAANEIARLQAELAAARDLLSVAGLMGIVLSEKRRKA